LRAVVARKKQFLGVQINNLNNAIAVGSTSYRLLLLTLECEERKEAQVAMELRKPDEEIQKNMCARPEAKDVAAYWAEFVELWPELTDEEKLEMIGHLVKRIEVGQKNSIFLELAPVGGKCCSSVERKFLTTSELGAVLHEVTNYPDLHTRGFAVLRPVRKGVYFRRTTSAGASQQNVAMTKVYLK